MSNQRQLVQIRTKKLGLLILDARSAQRKSIEECAEAVGVTPAQFQEFERGNIAPSLPQLELLALYFDVPIAHFWGKKSLSENPAASTLQEKVRLMALRNRMIGTQIRMLRNAVNFSYAEMLERTGIAEEALRQYEFGELPIPVPELEVLSTALDVPIERFYDQHGPVGKWRSQQDAMLKFLDLPPKCKNLCANRSTALI